MCAHLHLLYAQGTGQKKKNEIQTNLFAYNNYYTVYFIGLFFFFFVLLVVFSYRIKLPIFEIRYVYIIEVFVSDFFSFFNRVPVVCAVCMLHTRNKRKLWRKQRKKKKNQKKTDLCDYLYTSIAPIQIN